MTTREKSGGGGKDLKSETGKMAFIRLFQICGSSLTVNPLEDLSLSWLLNNFYLISSRCLSHTKCAVNCGWKNWEKKIVDEILLSKNVTKIFLKKYSLFGSVGYNKIK